MKEMSIHKIIVGSISFIIGLFVLISMAFMVFGYDLSALTQGPNSFDLMSRQVSTGVSGVTVKTPLDVWLLALIGSNSHGSDTVDIIVGMGMALSIVLLVAAIVLMILSVVSIFLFSQKSNGGLAYAVDVVAAVLTLLLMIFGIVASSVLNDEFNLEKAGIEMTTKAYGGFIMVAVAIIGQIIYLCVAKRTGFNRRGALGSYKRSYKKSLETEETYSEAAASTANHSKKSRSNADIHDDAIELLCTLKRLHEKELYNDIEFSEEKQKVLINACNLQKTEITEQKQRLKYMEKYFDLTQENVLTLKEFEYIKKKFS